MRLQQLLLPPLRYHQLLKLMVTQWRFMAGDAALSLRIASNVIREDIRKLRWSKF